MTRKESLTALLAKVEAGGDVRPSTFKVLRDPDRAAWAVRAYNGSLDAAKALHEAVLPGYRWEGYQGECFRVWQPDKPEKFIEGWDCHPARAWLIAILRALHAKEKNDE